ncbi:MAG: bifunctional phosphopantothenoylcysteine decarboxylase/phosphopantothenate--cysteine ligase CoaBC [Desulfamplus sp.]|nr:bifunctional phosphopantothenoylcysteine decarboxylase/phosphopantothenate--cysteine ligase CoaBC [Desulfamplus sp.]
MLKDKTIILGVCGGIAAYKSVELLRLIKKAGANVKVIMTRSALEFVGLMTFQVLSENDVMVDLFNSDLNKSCTSKEASVRHIEWATGADAVVIAPATANIIGKLANGIADDALSTVMMAVKSPVMVCPSMNTFMYENRALQRNLDILEQDGTYILEPGTGELACKTSGAGRLPEPEVIFDRLVKIFYPKDLKGKKILVSAGPTREAIDPVRYISNHSSGKMGYAVAEAAEKRGGLVTLVSGPVAISAPFGVDLIKVESAQSMADAMVNLMQDADIIIKVAAVADYRPLVSHQNKIKKQGNQTDKVALSIDLTENQDILKMLGENKRDDQFLAGFAAETQNLDEHAVAKMEKKNLDMIVGNIVGVKGSGFEADTNKVKFFFKDGTTDDLPMMDKLMVANRLFDHIVSFYCNKK